MNDQIFSILKAEIGRRLCAGERGFKLKEVAEAVGVQLTPVEAYETFKDIRAEIEADGLAVIKHVSDQETNYYADVVELTDEGRDLANWES